MNRKTILLVLAICFFNISVTAQSNNKFSFETSAGYHRFPVILFGIDKSVTKHPDSLSGVYREHAFSYGLNRKWSLGLSFIDSTVSGYGEWARSSTQDELNQGGVAGIITGETKLSNQGFIFNVRRYFGGSKTGPYLQVGGGMGWLDVKFTGQFIGHETESGLNFPVVEDARDRITRRIPLVGLETGLEHKLGDHAYFTAAPYWNTGFGIKLGLGITF